MNNKSSLLSVASLFIVLIVFFFFILPQTGVLRETRHKLGVKKAEASALTQRVNALNTLKSQFQSLGINTTRLKIALPAEPKHEELFVMTESMAGKAGVNLANIQPTSSSDSGARTTRLAITVTGDYQGMIRFTQEINSNIRPSVIKSVSLVANDQSAGQTTVTGTFDVEFLTVTSAVDSAEKTEEKDE